MHVQTVCTRPSFSTPAKYEGLGMRLHFTDQIECEQEQERGGVGCNVLNM